MAKKTFGDYFKESMDSLGLPVPASLFATITTATASTKVLLDLVAKYGTRATFREVYKTAPAVLRGAPLLAEIVGIAGAVTVSFYVGACVGALIYATQQYVGDNLLSSNGSELQRLQRAAVAVGIEIPVPMFTALASHPVLDMVEAA